MTLAMEHDCAAVRPDKAKSIRMVPKVQAKMDFMMKIEGLNEAMNRVAGVTRMRMQARLMMDGREKTRAFRRDLRPKKICHTYAHISCAWVARVWRKCGNRVELRESAPNDGRPHHA